MSTDYKSIMLWLLDGRSYTEISTSLGCSRKTISHTKHILTTNNLTVNQIHDLTTTQIEELFPDHRRRDPERFLQPDMEAIAQRRMRRKRVTRKVEWERYLTQPTSPGIEHYSYPQFCSLFDAYVDEQNLSTVINHLPGETMEVDWAGEAMTVTDPLSGQEHKVSIFVAALPFSGMLYVSGWFNQQMRSWLYAHQQAFDYFGGVTRIVVPDNTSTATNQVTPTTRVRDLNKHYATFSRHFGFGAVAARSYKPKDKPSVEKGVDIIERWIIEYLDDRTFFSLDQLNHAIHQRVDWINNRSEFRGRDISRREIFEEFEQPELLELPSEPWSWAQWRKSKVGMNYHIRVDNHFYSVPWKLAGKTVDTCILDTAVEVIFDNEIVARHRRAPANFQYSTSDEHVPPSHKDLGQRWDRDRILSWAQSIGTSTFTVIEQMFNSRKVEAQAYNSALAVLALAKDYSRIELEQACQVIVATKQMPSTRKVKDQLAHLRKNPEALLNAAVPPIPAPTPRSSTGPASLPDTSNVRGAGAFVFKEVD